MNKCGERRSKRATLKISLIVSAHEIRGNAKLDLNKDPGVGIVNSLSRGGITTHTESIEQEKWVSKSEAIGAYIQSYPKNQFIVDFGALERAKRISGHQLTDLLALPTHTRSYREPRGLRGESCTAHRTLTCMQNTKQTRAMRESIRKRFRKPKMKTGP